KAVDIVTASNATQAQAQLDVFEFDLFLLDLDIKDGCSLELLAAMTERFPLVPMVLMTTEDIQSKELIDKIEIIRSGHCWHLLEKPFDYKKLAGFIDRGLYERKHADLECHQCDILGQHEKRRCQRFSRLEQLTMSLPLSDDIPNRTSALIVTLTDISVGGFGITADRPLTEKVKVHFNEKFMHQSGVVVWSQNQENHVWRSGVKFI
ncbi:MAG: PilZ domain-containing protein, partial [Deltaproteobacteria bacterium]|nr:PilZ domain-containing protein [Deltaproteobacteria bacterium]